jgi:hypothetical protein
MKKNKAKPKFGIMVAVTDSPVGEAYKKAMAPNVEKKLKKAVTKKKVKGK